MTDAKAVKAAARATAARTIERVRKNRTLSLDDAAFRQLQRHCIDNGLRVSQVVDDLIGAYLAEVESRAKG